MADEDPFPWVVFHFADGSELHARPGVDADVVDILHDAAHHLLALAMGQEGSPALRFAVKGEGLDHNVVHAEEAAVLAIQTYLRQLLET